MFMLKIMFNIKISYIDSDIIKKYIYRLKSKYVNHVICLYFISLIYIFILNKVQVSYRKYIFH